MKIIILFVLFNLIYSQNKKIDFNPDLLNDPDWTQIGMNPFRHSYFYDKATGSPVTRAAEVIQVGPLVLAKGVSKPTISELRQMGVRTTSGKRRMFDQGGLTMEQQMSLFQEPIKAHEGTIVYNQGGSGTGLPLQPPPQNTVTGEGIKDPTTGEAIDDQPTPDISETAVEDPDPNVINTDVETKIAINPETGKPFTLEELLPIIDKPGIDPFKYSKLF